LGRPQQQGYQKAIAEMTQRFDVNNKEMNRKKFSEQTQHVLSKGKKPGAKFVNKVVDMNVTSSEEEEKTPGMKRPNTVPPEDNDSQGLALGNSSSDDDIVGTKRKRPLSVVEENNNNFMAKKRAKLDSDIQKHL
jgi:hypothetical protein